MFSGGRDSSALLAVAVGVARREGLPLPVPFTMRFPGEAEAEESRYQEEVIAHLRLTEWAKVDANADADLLGPVAQAVLRRHGVIWPPLLSTRVGHMKAAAGGSLVSGEGGDEVFGAYRSTPLVRLGRERRPGPAVRLAKASAAALLPRRQRAARLRASFGRDLGLSWLRPGVREEYLGRLADQWAAQPFAWGQAIAWVARSRHVWLGIAHVVALAAEMGATYCAPFLDARFIEVIGQAFGYLGPAGRTAVMRDLFGPLLPGEVLARSTKAVFTLPAWGPRTREFVVAWSGKGLDEGLVDVEALRRHWSGLRPNAMTFALAQAAWLAGPGAASPGPAGEAPGPK
jgi:Asparagine synthase